MSNSNPQNGFLSPVEDAILRRYFGIHLQKAQDRLDLWAEDGDEGVHLEEGLDGYHDEGSAIANAVARLLLVAVQDRLPNWSAIRGDGEFVTTREKRSYAENTVAFLPVRLLTINWADSGPGFSWPEEYRAVWVPGFERYVVTASRDTAEGYGYADVAIGWFPGDGDLKKGALEVIKAHWEEQWLQYEQHRWECIFDEGLITASEADSLAGEVWDAEDFEEEESDEGQDALDEHEPEQEVQAKDAELAEVAADVLAEASRYAVSVSSLIENPVVLGVWKHLSCYVAYDDLIKAYCNLGSVRLLVGYSYVTGMGQIFYTGAVRDCVPPYCKEFYERNGYFPMGVHKIEGKVSGNTRIFHFKFPETAPIVSAGSDRRLITGPATCLERDWYLHGTTVHNINPDDTPEVILRAPIRNDLHAEAVAWAISFLLNSRKVRSEVRTGFKVAPKDIASRILAAVESISDKDGGYPPNLAELWRRQKEIGHSLNPLIEVYATHCVT